MTIYSHKKSLFIKTEKPIESGSVEVLDFEGRKVITHRLENTNYKKIPVSLPGGKYIVKVIAKGKIIIRQLEF